MPDELARTSAMETVLRGLLSQLPSSIQTRVDGWANLLTSVGTVSDKTTHTAPTEFCRLSDEALAAMFHGDAIVRKIVSKRVRSALRTGFQVNVPDDAGGSDTATDIQDAADELDAVGKIVEAVTWEELFGGAVLWIGVDDGQRELDSQSNPIRMQTLRKVLWIKVIDRRYIWPSSAPEDTDLDPASPTFGESIRWNMQASLGIAETITAKIHRDRLIIFPGTTTTTEIRRVRSGWGISAIDPIYDALQRYITACASAGNAVANAQYTVYALKGLATMIGAPDGEAKMKARSKAMEMAKSMLNAIMIDVDDKYTREKIDFGNLPDMLDRFMIQVASAADMTVTELFGTSAKGMDATGEGDREQWEASVEEMREHRLRQRIQRLVELIIASKEGPTKGAELDGWRVTFRPLEMLSAEEQAKRYLAVAQADALYVTNNVLTASEVATSRFRAEGYSTDTVIDIDARDTMQQAEVDAISKGLELAANSEPPTDAAATATNADQPQPAPAEQQAA